MFDVLEVSIPEQLIFSSWCDVVCSLLLPVQMRKQTILHAPSTLDT